MTASSRSFVGSPETRVTRLAVDRIAVGDHAVAALLVEVDVVRVAVGRHLSELVELVAR